MSVAQAAAPQLAIAPRDGARMMAVMSHEIRTPMNAIIGLAGMLLDSNLTPEQRHHAETLRDAADGLLHVIDDILDLTRLEATGVKLAEESFDLAALMASVVEMMGPAARAKGLALTVELPPDTPARLRGDAGRLRQVLVNLIGNGIKFTERGGVHVAVAASPDAGANGDPTELRLQFRVRDTGIGISAEGQARLFQPFAQEDDSIARRFGGTGLGLAICRRLVEAMDGSIGVRSRQGLGSEFRFDVRLRAERRAKPRPSASAATLADLSARARARPLAILVAEDNATNRLVAAARLERLGHSVALAVDGQEAVERLASDSFDLVLMDVMMPRLDGLAATRAIRALLGPGSATPIVALTAGAHPSDQEAALDAGMDLCLVKPVPDRALYAALAAAIEGALRPPPDARDSSHIAPEALACLATGFLVEPRTKVTDCNDTTPPL